MTKNYKNMDKTRQSTQNRNNNNLIKKKKMRAGSLQDLVLSGLK